MHANELKNGEHFWGIMDQKLVMAMKTENCYEVCGPWECGASFNDIEVIAKVERPEGNENTELYYV